MGTRRAVLSAAIGSVCSLLTFGWAAPAPGAQVQFRVPALTIPPATSAELVISTPTNMTGLQAPGFSFLLRYNPLHFRYISTQIACPIACDFTMSAVADSTLGLLSVLCYDSQNYLEASGDLCRIRFYNRGTDAASNCRYLTCLSSAFAGESNEVEVLYDCPGGVCTLTDAPEPVAIGGLRVIPNPTLTSAEIHASPDLRAGARSLEIFDVRGRSLLRLDAGAIRATAGPLFVWDGRDERGQFVPGGVYWIRLRGNSFDRSVKLIRTK